MDIEETLSEPEREVLLALNQGNESGELAKVTGLKEIEVQRALQWLSNKGLVKIEKRQVKFLELGENGVRYRSQGLPERVFLNTLSSGKKKAGEIPLSSDELQVSIGLLKRKGAIQIVKSMPLEFALTEEGRRILGQKWLEERLLERLGQPILMDELAPEELHAAKGLLSRKDIVKIVEKSEVVAEPTEKGSALSKLSHEKRVGRLTPELITSGGWKTCRFRAYDVKASVPQISGGRQNVLYQAIAYVRRVWLDMGFTEMTGTHVQQSFWNFDALFTAQDHPVRDIHDTFFLKNPAKGKLPNAKLVAKVRATHEHGYTTGSRGWEYEWDAEEAKRNVMRTHTTVLSARTLASLKPSDLPGKFFSIARNFRNETVDWKHGCEFYQVEGIVASKGVTFRHLLGYLREYYSRLGYSKVRFRPSYFPYTEMSVEPEVYNESRKEWVELGGAGILRPEVVKPLLGVDIPVLAWGQGLERGIMLRLGMKDLRDIYSNDLKKLRNARVWIG